MSYPHTFHQLLDAMFFLKEDGDNMTLWKRAMNLWELSKYTPDPIVANVKRTIALKFDPQTVKPKLATIILPERSNLLEEDLHD